MPTLWTRGLRMKLWSRAICRTSLPPTLGAQVALGLGVGQVGRVTTILSSTGLLIPRSCCCRWAQKEQGASLPGEPSLLYPGHGLPGLTRHPSLTRILPCRVGTVR